jgi:hypothetical protein
LRDLIPLLDIQFSEQQRSNYHELHFQRVLRISIQTQEYFIYKNCLKITGVLKHIRSLHPCGYQRLLSSQIKEPVETENEKTKEYQDDKLTHVTSVLEFLNSPNNIGYTEKRT